MIFIRALQVCFILLLLLAIAIVAKDAFGCESRCPSVPPKPRTVYITKTVEAKSVPSNTNNQATATVSSAATTGNQTVNVIQPQQKLIVVRLKRTVIKHRTKVKHIRVNHYRNNRLLLLGGVTKTRLNIDFDCCNLDVKRRYEPDFGLQYIRDFGTLSAGIAATSNRSVYLNLGVNW